MAAASVVIGPSGTRNWCLGKASYPHGFNLFETQRLRLRKDWSFSRLQGNEGNSNLCGCGESFSGGGVGYKQKFTGRVVRSMLTSKRSALVVTGPIAAHTMLKSECQKNTDVTRCKDAQLDTGDNFLPTEVIEVDGDVKFSVETVDRVHLQLVALGFILGGFLLSSNSEAMAAEGLPIHHLAGFLDEGFDVGEWIQESLFYLGQEANGVVKSQLAAGNTFASVGVIFGAGLVTSFSPCTLSVLPLTIGYIGGYDSSKSRASVAFDSVAFALGLATTLAGLGIVASLAGKAYGQIGQGLPIAVSCVAILMGLNLLQVVPLQLPSFFSSYNPKESAAGLPSGAQAYLAGLTFALAASPCSTPVLATLLSFVATTQDPVAGGGLLLAYTTGYVSPLLVAATFTGALKRLLSFRQYSKWINPTSGALLLGGGVYSLLTRVFPESSMMNNMIM